MSGRDVIPSHVAAAGGEPELGYDVHFLSDLDRKYVCPVCLAALKDPVQTRCGHRFCMQCLQRCTRNLRYSKCPVDNILIDATKDIFADNATRREVLSLDVRCPSNEGECDWTGDLRSLETHTDTCPTVPVPCPNGCSVRRRRRSLEKHMGSCPCRLDSCCHCQAYVKVVDIAKHQLLTCPCFPVNCSFCGEGVQRQDVPAHTNVIHGDCAKVMVKCPFHIVGCQYQALRESMAVHHEACMFHHMLLLATRSHMQDEKLLQHEEMLVGQLRSSHQFSGLVSRHNSLLEDQRRLLLTECHHMLNMETEMNSGHLRITPENYINHLLNGN